MNKIGVFYGSTTGTTEDLARRIAEKLDVPSAHIYDVSKLTEALVGEYDVLVLGSSTWGAGELQDDWYDGIKILKKCDLSHKQLLCSVVVIPILTAIRSVMLSVFFMKN